MIPAIKNGLAEECDIADQIAAGQSLRLLKEPICPFAAHISNPYRRPHDATSFEIEERTHANQQPRAGLDGMICNPELLHRITHAYEYAIDLRCTNVPPGLLDVILILKEPVPPPDNAVLREAALEACCSVPDGRVSRAD